MGWKREEMEMQGAEIGLVYLRHERGAYEHSCVFETTLRGLLRTILFIRGDTGMRACECVSVSEKESELKERSLRRETNTNSHKMRRNKNR